MKFEGVRVYTTKLFHCSYNIMKAIRVFGLYIIFACATCTYTYVIP